MALGKSHDKFNFLMGITLLLILVAKNLDFLYCSIFLLGWIYSTFYFSPDSDLLPKKRLGYLRVLFYPYTLLFKHRGSSHHIILGTFFRIIYSFFVLYFIIWLLNRFEVLNFHPKGLVEFVTKFNLDQTEYKLMAWFFIGMFMADFCHIFLDKVSDLLKWRNFLIERFDMIISIIGLFSLTLMGIKKVSEYYQSLNGKQIKKILSDEKNQLISPFLTGFSLAALIQSASLVIGMLMNFIHAKVVKIERAFFLVWGANVGTTLGFWILLLPGQNYAFELLGVGFLFSILSQKISIRSSGHIIMGLGLVFLSLKIFGEYLVYAKFDFLNLFSGELWKIIVFYCWLCMAAYVLPTSIMLLGPLLVLLQLGKIPFSYALLAVMVVNLGSSLKGISYVRTGKHNSHLLGYMHLMLNMFSFWFFFLSFVLILRFDRENILFRYFQVADGIKLTLFNSFYNVFMGWGYFFQKKFVNRYKVKGIESDEFYSWTFDNSLIPAIPLFLAKEQVLRLVNFVSSLASMINTQKDEKILNAKNVGRMKIIEGKTDMIHQDLRRFLSVLMKRRLNAGQSAEALGYLRIADELESLADYFDKIVSLRVEFLEQIDQDHPYWQEFYKLENGLIEYFEKLVHVIESNSLKDKEKFVGELDKIREQTHRLKRSLLDLNVFGNEIHLSAIAFVDMHQYLNKIRGHLYKITAELGIMYERQNVMVNNAF